MCKDKMNIRLRPYLKIILFPVDRPDEFILRLYLAAFKKKKII